MQLSSSVAHVWMKAEKAIESTVPNFKNRKDSVSEGIFSFAECSLFQFARLGFAQFLMASFISLSSPV
jgi:hypothetical protein